MFPGVGSTPEATLTSHTNKDVLSSSTETFTWDTVPGAEAYQITIRNPVIDFDIKFTENYGGSINSATIDNLPRNSSPLLFTLSTLHNGSWAHQNYPLIGSNGFPDSKIISPAENEIIKTPSVTITWNNAGADAYYVRITDTSNRVKLHEQTYGADVTRTTINNLPKNSQINISVHANHGIWWNSHTIRTTTNIP